MHREMLTEVMRDPSVIVYTPAGFVGVHFPTRNRTRFESAEPSDAEARRARAYLGYYAALGLYPGGRHQGLIFHNILGGSFTIGTTLRRFFDLQGDDVNLTFPANLNRQGIRSQNLREDAPSQQRRRHARALEKYREAQQPWPATVGESNDGATTTGTVGRRGKGLSGVREGVLCKRKTALVPPVV